MSGNEYNKMELMITLASRNLEDNSTVVVGTGAPCAAAMLSQKTVAPNLVIMFEAGGMGPQLPTMPISVGDSRTFYKGIQATSMAEIMEYCQMGMVDYTFLGGAQIDKHGNLNSTIIGDNYEKPKVRLPGSGGANDLASLAWNTMVMTPHDSKRFVEKVDFLTTPGYLSGKGKREEAGLPPGSGPYKVITDLCVMGYDEDEKRMQVESIHPGIDRKQIEENTGFELLWSDDLVDSKPPTKEELELLRNKVDPYGYIIGRA
ncbi:CoA-transferase subunit beta [Natranaerofaba carboxydovora]|uniref:CoA-transferase subunit beta n=1 Tax=Natranaerofaba carboxydovora TaxID=2742683 RepID=UPI001F13F72B|nr:CoA-transferase [Natranaerofaba carboxydovora]UMZ73630.1 3-oxoadipate CoA-transferase subunit B [Natranaerofaba carboxydovora]